ncbi:hypothetical protein FYK55_00475 [Roseiconus nitratireducens]|uniref:Uncharacterized protein n=1 Tax=Roseiconus nitratireducens TaxID=2605748 RepID=A0A5M6DM73_9BACT|nr:hypothetical protein FYK55_00475 [Roseiconus nitratireducens]
MDIVGCGLLGGFAAVPFLALHNPLGFATVLVGCIFGGLVYRFRSRDWPHDPSIPRRQLWYSALAVILPPGVLFLLAGPRGQGPGFIVIGLVIGVSVAVGILISGTRRLNATREAAEQSDGRESRT